MSKQEPAPLKQSASTKGSSKSLPVVASSEKQRAKGVAKKNTVDTSSVVSIAQPSTPLVPSRKADDLLLDAVDVQDTPKPRRRSTPKTSTPLMASPAKYVAPPKVVAPKEEVFEPAGLTEPVLPKSGKITARYSDADLQMFKRHIESVRRKEYDEYLILREQLDEVTSSELADENASYSMHMAEQGTDAQEKEKIYAQVQRKIEYIKKLDEALQRIKEKTYGICKMCGCLINKERLLMVPITTLSVSYKIHSKCPEDGVDRITARIK